MSDALAAVTIGLHLFTAHSAGGLEPVNPGIYARTEAGLTVGVMRNSYRRTSVYGGWTFETADRRFALTVGAVHGYPAKPALLPLVVPSVRFELGEHTAARLAFVPKPPTYGRSHGLHLMVEREL